MSTAEQTSMLAGTALLQQAVGRGVVKAAMPLPQMLVLGWLGGAFISLGYLACLKIIALMPPPLSGLGALLGAAVFPIGLVCILMGGGELITGNMMLLPLARLQQRINWRALWRNWLWVSLSNLVGALCVAWFFGHYLGLTEGNYAATTAAAAHSKIQASFGEALVSGIGCNWLVCMAVWLAYAARDAAGKILAIWFPIMVIVLMGFQHVVANMFVIPAAIWGGADISWSQFWNNLLPVYLGNLLGGALLVGGLYAYAYRPNPS